MSLYAAIDTPLVIFITVKYLPNSTDPAGFDEDELVSIWGSCGGAAVLLAPSSNK